MLTVSYLDIEEHNAKLSSSKNISTSERCRRGKEGGGREGGQGGEEKEKREVEEGKGREFFLTCIMNSFLFPDSLPITHTTPHTQSVSLLLSVSV